MKLRKRNSESGMAAVEFALVLPVFMLLLFSIVEFGGAFYKQQIITSAAREAARAGVVASDPRPSSATIAARARDYLTEAGLDSDSSTISIIGAGGNSGEELAIEVGYPTEFKLVSHFIAMGNSAETPGVTTLNSRIVVELE